MKTDIRETITATIIAQLEQELSSSKHVLPSFSLVNPVDHRVVHPKEPADLAVTQLSAKFPNLDYVLLGQFRVTVRLAALHQASSNGMCCVARRRHILQITRPVLNLPPITMIDGEINRAWPNESRGYKLMDVYGGLPPVLAKSDSLIAMLQPRTQQSIRSERINSPRIAYLVQVLEANKTLPMFQLQWHSVLLILTMRRLPRLAFRRKRGFLWPPPSLA